jgi:ABC-type glycerol-3-phosphate transport system substrate-binding protein
MTRALSRRAFLGAAGAAALAGCAADPAPGKIRLRLSTWNIAPDLVSYRAIADRYQELHPDVEIAVEVTPGGDFNQWLTTRLAADRAPDLIRIIPQQFGRYVETGGMVDIAPWLPPGYGDDYRENFWSIVAEDGGVYGLPQHTDNFITFYRRDILDRIGVPPPPDAVDHAGTWAEFIDVAREVKRVTGAYGFSVGFGGVNNAYRWLPFLYMHGGRLVEDDLVTPAIENDAGVEALEWTRRWYAEGLVSLSNTVKGSQGDTATTLFATDQAGLMLNNPTALPTLQESIPEETWDTRYMIQDVGRASDCGGNVLAVTRSCQHPEVAADFLAFLNDPENTTTFCRGGGWVPVRKSIDVDEVGYSYRPDTVARFLVQQETVPADMIAVETSPTFNVVNQVLGDYLDLCLIGSITPREAAASIAEGIRNVRH